MKMILVTEDEPEMRRNITTLLRFQDDEPIAAENGRVGIEMARREQPDLILCDVMMPELDGYGVLRSIPSLRNQQDLEPKNEGLKVGESTRGLSPMPTDFGSGSG
jgi:CheY-like chemotaxis protein